MAVLQGRLGLLPKGAVVVSDSFAVVRSEGRLTCFNAGGPVFECSEEDHHGIRLACALAVELKLATAKDTAAALGVHRATVFRSQRSFRKGGAAALKPEVARRGPHKLKGEVLDRAQELLDEGRSQSETAKTVGVTHGTIHHALKVGRLKRPAPSISAGLLKSVGERAREDQRAEAGVAVKRTIERTAAAAGQLREAAPCFEATEAAAAAGVLLALPALLQQGLLEVSEKVYGALNNGFFGLRSTLLVLAFMSLLRIKSPEQLGGHAPGELGLALGLDRAPEVKTLRRKLRELGARGQAHELLTGLARRWAEDDSDALAVLYVDGHVRPYHGRNGKHTLPKRRVPRIRLSMPATSEFWVNDKHAQPLLVVTGKGTQGLLATLDNQILPQVRELVGSERRTTLVFDREGWSPDKFKRWHAQGFDILTYRKGAQEQWPEHEFAWVEEDIEGHAVRYQLAERGVQLRPGFWVREIRRWCTAEHQTAFIATDRGSTAVALAGCMFSRWRQENFFRYMRHEFALDHLCTYAVDPDDPERLVPSPLRKRKAAQLRAVRNKIAELQTEYGQKALDNPERQRPTIRGFKIAHGAVGKQIRALRDEAEGLAQEVRDLPPKVPLRDVTSDKEIVRLEDERKRITDAIKMVAYRAESALAGLLAPLFARHSDEARAFLKAVFRLPADLVPDQDARTLTVRLHGMANPRSTRVLRQLCEINNAAGSRYPGTDLRLTFEVV